jgi:RimJ/RimL family protein N-acetyltransferase
MKPHTGTRTLETPRLLLRRYREDDAPFMFARWCGDPAVTEHLTWPAHASVDVTRTVLADWIPRYDAPEYYHWAVTCKDLEGPVGDIAVVKLTGGDDISVRCGEIGWCLGRAFWGQGIMPEAFRAVRDWLFDEAGFTRLCAGHAVANPKSGRVMMKTGMTRIGTARQAGIDNTGIVDMVLYDLLPGDPRL